MPDHLGYGKKDAGFMIMTYDELMQEASSIKDLGDLYCHVAPEDIMFFNVSKYSS